MANFDPESTLKRFRTVLQDFLTRLKEDRYILAAVLVGSLNEKTIWRKDSLHLWIIEQDGVTRRFLSDGKSERLFRTFVEEGINIHAEVIPRSRFKQMIDGSSRTTFSCNFFAQRELVYCEDDSIQGWFEEANDFATKDQEKELLATTTWAIHEHRWTTKMLEIQGDLELTKLGLLGIAHALAALEIVIRGEVYEELIIYKAIEHNPDLFQVIYLDVLSKRKSKKFYHEVLERVDQCLQERAEAHLKPLLHYLRKEQRVVPLSELCDHFAFTQLYPWHLESACEWLVRKGMLDKMATPIQITSKSRVEVEEPAYHCD